MVYTSYQGDTYISLISANAETMAPDNPQKKHGSRDRLTYAGIPSEIMELVDKVIESRKYGYISRNQFVNEAVKNRLRDLGYYK